MAAVRVTDSEIHRQSVLCVCAPNFKQTSNTNTSVERKRKKGRNPNPQLNQNLNQALPLNAYLDLKLSVPL